MAYGVVPDQGPNPRHLHGQAGSYSHCATGKVLDLVLILGEDYTVLSSFYMQRLCFYMLTLARGKYSFGCLTGEEHEMQRSKVSYQDL